MIDQGDPFYCFAGGFFRITFVRLGQGLELGVYVYTVLWRRFFNIPSRNSGTTRGPHNNCLHGLRI